VQNVIFLNRLSPTPGAGWQCFECGLPANGAVAVLCDPCPDAGAEIRFVCTADPAEGGRTPLAELSEEKFKHRLEFHPEAFYALTWFDDSPDFGHPDCRCSVCGDQIPEIEEEEQPALFGLRLYREQNPGHPHGQEARFCVDCLPLVTELIAAKADQPRPGPGWMGNVNPVGCEPDVP
jgi:hypothetical protein